MSSMSKVRLGFSVGIYGLPHLPAHDARRWPQVPHLSVSLAYLRDILCCLRFMLNGSRKRVRTLFLSLAAG